MAMAQDVKLTALAKVKVVGVFLWLYVEDRLFGGLFVEQITVLKRGK